MLGPTPRSRASPCELELEPDLPAVRYDRDALLQVLFNLVDNALKYARRADDKEIRAALPPAGRRRRPGGRRPRARGRRRQLKKIFEPFYRGEDELTRRTKGTGIGLALVRGLVEQMGGTVAGRNVEGGGFEVEVFLAA